MRDTDELRALKDFDAGAPPLDDETRRRARARLFAAITAAHGPAPVRRGRPVLRIALTGVVAASVAAGVLVAVQEDDGTEVPTAKPPAASSPPMRNVSVQTVLNGAAAYERTHERAASPRDDQFIYTKEIIKETDQKTGSTKSYTDEDWRSVDGSQRSWVMEIGHGWWSPPLAKNESIWPPQDWGTLKKLPTDPEKLILSLLPKTGPDDRNDSLDGIAEEEWSQIHFGLTGLLKLVPVMPEGLRPAAYEALGMVPGVRTVPHQKDAKGRTGVAITYDDPMLPKGATGFGGYFIFDPETYRFLGFRDERSSGDGKDMKRYTQLSYLDSWAVVDRAKQQP
ncbi:CU044_5270 family protein [Streptomyces sp. NPDC050421]|uniref:CU044_5270 family protein n=1 Tax=unclassified Streptomyces TaxID=2593676 RepID=UPI00379E1F81